MNYLDVIACDIAVTIYVAGSDISIVAVEQVIVEIGDVDRGDGMVVIYISHWQFEDCWCSMAVALVCFETS